MTRHRLHSICIPSAMPHFWNIGVFLLIIPEYISGVVSSVYLSSRNSPYSHSTVTFTFLDSLSPNTDFRTYNVPIAGFPHAFSWIYKCSLSFSRTQILSFFIQFFTPLNFSNTLSFQFRFAVRAGIFLYIRIHTYIQWPDECILLHNIMWYALRTHGIPVIWKIRIILVAWCTSVMFGFISEVVVESF